MFDLVVNGVSSPQLTQQRAQIFVQIKYIYCQWFAHPRIVYRIMWFPWSLFFFVLSWFSAELGKGHICHHGNLCSVNLLGPGSDYYLLRWDSVSPMEPEYCTIFIGGGFISSCHSPPVPLNSHSYILDVNQAPCYCPPGSGVAPLYRVSFHKAHYFLKGISLKSAL